MSLYEELTVGALAAEIAPFLAGRNDTAIAEIYNRGRTKLAETRVGNLNVISLLGLVDGNRLLDAVYANPAFKYITADLQAGRLNVADPIVRSSIDQLVTAQVIKIAQGDLLKNLALIHDPVSVDTISNALNGGV